jgi:glycosyltransferase involved in cell wall biosynthesis
MVSITTPLKTNDRKPRVLVSGHLPPPIGGIATYFLALLNSSLPDLVDLSFVQTSSQNRALSSSGQFTLINLLSAILDCSRFTWQLIKHRPRVTHISTAFGASFLKHSICVWIAKLGGSRVLLHPRCSITILYFDRPKWWQWYFRLVIRQTSGVLALSREWIQLSSIVPSCKIYYLPNAIDQTLYRKIAEQRLTHHEKHTPSRILYLGYVGKDKGSFDLVEAAKILMSAGRSVIINIVGDELHQGEKDQLSERIQIEGLADLVHLHPAVYKTEKLDYFRDADIFVYPSYHEGLPNAVLEAMACALPIVATNVGGIPDQVEDGVNGILVNPRQPDELAKALVKLLDERTLRNKMQKMSHQFATEKFDMKQYIPRLANIYKTIGEE